MNKKLEKFIDIAAAIVPALGSLAKDDKTEHIANDIAAILRAVSKNDDPDVIKATVAKDPEVRAELEIRLAEITNNRAEAENRATEELYRSELNEARQKHKQNAQDHEFELERIAKELESTKAARTYAQNATLSDKWWVSSINPILSLLITASFLVFVYLVATIPIEDGDDSNKEVFYVAFGALATAFVTVIGFHFGSSSGSKRKTEIQRLYGTRGTIAPMPAHDDPPSGAVKTTSTRGQRRFKKGEKNEHTFELFWMKNLSHIRHFNWQEFLFKGASNERFGSNTDPVPNLYRNVVPLVNILDKIRKEVGEPIQLISVYRSPEYNRDIGGATSSRHMQFDAADFKVLGPNAGNSKQWSKVVKKLRDRGEFAGGIGIYGSFVHVDTRGRNADWDER